MDEMSIVDADDVKVEEQVLDLSYVSCSVPLKKRKISSIKSGDQSVCDESKEERKSAFNTESLVSPSSTSSISSLSTTSSSNSHSSPSSVQPTLNNPPTPLGKLNYTDSLNCNIQQQSAFTTGNSKQPKFIEVTASETPPSHFLSSPFKTGYNRNFAAANTSTGQGKGVSPTYLLDNNQCKHNFALRRDI